MRRTRLVLPLVALCLGPLSAGVAQSADPSGHWEGQIKVPDRPVGVEVDVAKNAKGELMGTFGNPGQGVKGLPLGSVSVDGKAVKMVLKANVGGGTFDGLLADDGKTITGTFNTTEGGYSIPFTLTRTGDAVIEGPPKSPAVTKDLEGTWNGTLDVNGNYRRLILKITNVSDGTSTGSITTVDGGGLEIPITTVQKGPAVTLEVKMVGGSFTGALNPNAKELVGTWIQGTLSLPLTFKKDK